MSKHPTSNPPPSRPTIVDGYQPVERGFQPTTIAAPIKPQGGHQPTVGQGPAAAPPNEGSGGKKQG